MRGLVVIDAQNEFSQAGQRAIPGHGDLLLRIQSHVGLARLNGEPIAWVQHHNKPDESKAFFPGEWGAELSPGLEPRIGSPQECLFMKDVYGAFSTTNLAEWLRACQVDEVLLVGFFAHMCLSTSAREALVRGFTVVVDPGATGARDVSHPVLGKQSAEEVRRTALLQLADMGARIESFECHVRTVALTTRVGE